MNRQPILWGNLFPCWFAMEIEEERKEIKSPTKELGATDTNVLGHSVPDAAVEVEIRMGKDSWVDFRLQIDLP